MVLTHEHPIASTCQAEPDHQSEVSDAQPGVFFYPGQEAADFPLTDHEEWLMNRILGIMASGQATR